MYGDIFVDENDNSLDVSIELANGKYFKVYTDGPDEARPEGEYLHSVSLGQLYGNNNRKIYSRKEN